ncbi:MAG: lysophospholipid acyltransferase family protein [Bacteroidota bacterium]
MIAFCRACYKIVALGIFTSLLTLVYWVGNLVLYNRFYKTAWRQWIKKKWGQLSLAILNVKITYRQVGQEREPHKISRQMARNLWESSRFMVSNHCSYLDIPVLLSFCPGRFIAKREVKEWPVIGWLTRWYGTLYINRERIRSLFELNNIIEGLYQSNQRERIWLFPEGTTSNGEEVLPYLPSLLHIVEKNHPDIPVHNAVIQYSTPDYESDARDVVCWWRDNESFGAHAWQMLKISRISVTVDLYDKPFLAEDRKELVTDLEQAAWKQINKKSRTEVLL